jgi:hypothetical protein
MNKRQILLILFLLPILLSAQNRHFKIGIKNNGICFGNSSKFNGIRTNFIDKNVKDINGISICGQTESQKTNGISLGLYLSMDSIMNGLQIGGLGAGASKFNGLSISPGVTVHDTINGIAISGILTYFKTTNGLQLGLVGTTPFDFMESENLNGVAIGGITIYCTEKASGMILSSILCYSGKLNGVSISCFNVTDELHGFQFGLLNYARNNRKLFRLTPFVNFNLRKMNSR